MFNKKRVVCELRHGRKNPDQCRLLSTTYFSPFFVTSVLKNSPFLSIFSFQLSAFHRETLSFLWVMGTQSLPSWSKTSLFVLSAVQISSLDSPFVKKKKLFSFSFFAIVVVEKKTRGSVKKNFCLFLVYFSFCS